MRYGLYDVEITAEQKKCFFKTKDDKSGLLIHRASYIFMKHTCGIIVVFKITKKHNHYDSRDRMKKSVDASFIKAEISRMVGSTADGLEIYNRALSMV